MQYFLSKLITLRRLHVKDSNRTIWSATGTAWQASLQDPSPARQQFSDGQIGAMFDCFVPIECPVDESWQVVQNGVVYNVRDVSVRDFGSTQFKYLVVVKGT